VYQILPMPEAIDQIDALPGEALASLAEVFAVLQLKPWEGEPQHKGNPDGAVRRWLFGGGAGQLTYVILENKREVYILMVLWLG